MPARQIFNKKVVSEAQRAKDRKDAINKPNRHGTNAFFEAIESNNLQDVAKLFYEGADMKAQTTARGFLSNMTTNVPYNIGASPLHAACLLGSKDIVSFLVENGANPHAKDAVGHTPMDYAILSYAYYKNDLEAKEQGRFTLKHFLNKAASKVQMFEDVITQMLAKGAKPGMFELPEKFRYTKDGLPPAPPLP